MYNIIWMKILTNLRNNFILNTDIHVSHHLKVIFQKLKQKMTDMTTLPMLSIHEKTQT